MKLLICIASHNPHNRVEYLTKLIDNFKSYNVDVTILLQTNIVYTIYNDRVENCVYENLQHPYQLTWMHRQEMLKRINEYDWFGYFEDDMLLPVIGFQYYINEFYNLWPRFVPSFVRIEEHENNLYITDATEYENRNNIVVVNSTKWLSLKNPYHAFWLLPKEEIVKSLHKFVKIDTWRELAASYPMWDLNTIPLVPVTENYEINEKCYSFHLPNNYASFSSTPFGKIKIKELIK